MKSQPVTKNDLTEALTDFRQSLNKDLSKFATKDDLEKFATKDDLKKFATKNDLSKLATKEDLEKFATKKDLKLLEGELKDYVQSAATGIIGAMDEMFTEHVQNYHTPQTPLAH